jgi:hypothetical protein
VSSIPLSTAITLTEAQRREQARVNFETHRNRQVTRFFPSESIYDLTDNPRIDCWTEPPLVLKEFVDQFAFGEVLFEEDYSELVDPESLDLIVKAADEQLLYWHLAGTTTSTNHPVDQLLLWPRSDYLWFFNIPPERRHATEQLRYGNPVHFVDRVQLTYDHLQISFLEIRLLTPSSQLVITEGTELTYRWSRAIWETTLTNPDQSTIDPIFFHLPPENPDDPELVELLQARAPLPNLLSRITLPPSSENTSENTAYSPTHWTDQNITRCWCEELCTCNFRPQTPPTPPSVVLWTPGAHYLPTRDSV